MNARLQPGPEVEYPDSDGEPMADNDVQYRWIVTIKAGLEYLFRDRPDVYVAADHLIYPVQGDPAIRMAPDVYVAIGRPKGDRGSYKVWEEGGVFPQVVFEIRSPGNRAGGLGRKLAFYDQYGAEEYYLYDPDRNRLTSYRRVDGELDEVPPPDGLVSPRLGIRFDLSGPELVVYRPDGRRFLTYQELHDLYDLETRRAEAERQRAEAERQRADRLAEKLRGLGVDPDKL